MKLNVINAELSDCAIQTPLHFPPESNIDPDYRWNEWDLRREAMNLARLRRGSKKTKAAQTAVSAGARNKGNQVGDNQTDLGS